MDPLLLVFDKPFVKGIIAFVSDCQIFAPLNLDFSEQKCPVQG